MSNDAPNPFSSPAPSYGLAQPGHDKRQSGLGYVRQIPILAIMTIVQGVLLALVALLCTGYGIFFAFFFEGILAEAERAQMQAGAVPAPNPADPPLEIIGAIAIGIGVFILIISVLHFVAGIRALKYRGRRFIIVTWFLGLIASLTMYCAPTSIGLAIWGLIVFFNPAVKSAFDMVENGMDKKEVERQFY